MDNSKRDPQQPPEDMLQEILQKRPPTPAERLRMTPEELREADEYLHEQRERLELRDQGH